METAGQKLPTIVRNGVNNILAEYVNVQTTKDVQVDIARRVQNFLLDHNADATFRVESTGVNNYDKEHGWRSQRSFHEVNIHITMNDAPVWFETKDHPPTHFFITVTCRGLARSKDHAAERQFKESMKGI